nr:hypothetical protein Iba_chr06aCG0300 [Ipomoea batatas]GMD05000.1 hypothetical protein Iba_chr06bCG2460 [Ipomoea batatas]GMD11012.1 hypothetical protein Iba_chr06fCG0300 [Ipomoea batatas]
MYEPQTCSHSSIEASLVPVPTSTFAAFGALLVFCRSSGEKKVVEKTSNKLEKHTQRTKVHLYKSHYIEQDKEAIGILMNISTSNIPFALDLTMKPEYKKANKTNSKTKQENRLNTEKTSRLSHFNSAIVECALVGMLVYFINNAPNKIKRTSLH